MPRCFAPPSKAISGRHYSFNRVLIEFMIRTGGKRLVKNTRCITAALLAVIVILSFASCRKQESVPQNVPVDYSGKTVSFLGPVGTYTQEACEKFFGMDAELIPYETVPAAVDALTAGESDYAVIPIENTIGGAVTDNIDTLIANEGVVVVGEVELPINQNLLAIPGTELSDIKTVYSHKQGIAQGRDWLSANLPDAEIIEVSSTAEGARMVSESGDKSCAAIASAGCADVYGLELFAEAIQNNDKNVTRFYVLSLGEPGRDLSQRTAFIVTGSAEDLRGLIVRLSKSDVSLISVHERPEKTELGKYHYLIECTGIKYDELSTGFRFLGNFDVF